MKSGKARQPDFLFLRRFEQYHCNKEWRPLCSAKIYLDYVDLLGTVARDSLSVNQVRL
jgi:hypothetical protein